MSRYDYYTSVTADAIDAIREAISYGLDTRQYDSEELFNKLYEDMWVDDSVTGNGSGSYTFNASRAREYVSDNHDLVANMCREWCIDTETICEHFLNGDWEWFDVSCRCYVLGEALDRAMLELEETGEIIYKKQEAM